MSFERPQAAVDCAVEIQQTLAKQRREHGFAPDVRIGLHVGEVTEMAASLAGEDVHRASRIAGHAAGGEILASHELAQLTGSAGETRSIELKDFAGEIEVVSLTWR